MNKMQYYIYLFCVCVCSLWITTMSGRTINPALSNQTDKTNQPNLSELNNIFSSTEKLLSLLKTSGWQTES